MATRQKKEGKKFQKKEMSAVKRAIMVGNNSVIYVAASLLSIQFD